MRNRNIFDSLYQKLRQQGCTQENFHSEGKGGAVDAGRLRVERAEERGNWKSEITHFSSLVQSLQNVIENEYIMNDEVYESIDEADRSYL